MGFGRKRPTRGPRSRPARGVLWAAFVGGLMISLVGGCPPAGGARGPAVVRATATPVAPAGDVAQRELGRAFVAAARAHQALGLGDGPGARLALGEAEERLRAARDVAPPRLQRQVLLLEDRLIVARGRLDAGGPRDLLDARDATRELLDAMLATSPIAEVPTTRPTTVAAAPTTRPAGGGAGGGPPAKASPAAGAASQSAAAAQAVAVPKAVAVRRAMARGFASLAAARRELVAGRHQAATPHVRAARQALRTARASGTLAQQRTIAALDLRANQLAYLAGRGSDAALVEARGLTGEWLAAEDAMWAAPRPIARRVAPVRRAAARPAGGGAGGGPPTAKPKPTPEAPKARRTPPPADPTLTRPW